MMESGRSAALILYDRLQKDDRFVTAFPPELDIVVWASRASTVSESSGIARRIFAEAAQHHLHLALAELPVSFFDFPGVGVAQDRDTVTCLRSVLMKPEHREWIDRIWATLDEATATILRQKHSV